MPDIVRRAFTHGIAAAATSCLAPRIARAQAWPGKPIRIVVPYPAGGSPDGTARRIAEKLTAQLGQPILVENRPGAAALIGAKAVATAAADGYTLAYLSSAHATVQAMGGKLDLEREFAPITMVGVSPFVAVVNAASPWTTLEAFVAAARSKPGTLTYGTAGTGSPAHIAVERIRERLPGLDLVHVPFKGAIESTNALAGGQIDFAVGVMGVCLPHLKAGRLRALAVTTPQRVRLLPQVPTMQEAGVAEYRFDAWGGFAAPAGTPDAIVARLHEAIVRASLEPDYREYAEATGALVQTSASPQAFAREIAATLVVERGTVERLGLKER